MKILFATQHWIIFDTQHNTGLDINVHWITIIIIQCKQEMFIGHYYPMQTRNCLWVTIITMPMQTRKRWSSSMSICMFKKSQTVCHHEYSALDSMNIYYYCESAHRTIEYYMSVITIMIMPMKTKNVHQTVHQRLECQNNVKPCESLAIKQSSELRICYS